MILSGCCGEAIRLYDELRCSDCGRSVPPEEMCPECEEHRPDDDRVAAGMKCGFCAYGNDERYGGPDLGPDSVSALAGPVIVGWEE